MLFSISVVEHFFSQKRWETTVQVWSTTGRASGGRSLVEYKKLAGSTSGILSLRCLLYSFLMPSDFGWSSRLIQTPLRGAQNGPLRTELDVKRFIPLDGDVWRKACRLFSFSKVILTGRLHLCLELWIEGKGRFAGLEEEMIGLEKKNMFALLNTFPQRTSCIFIPCSFRCLNRKWRSLWHYRSAHELWYLHHNGFFHFQSNIEKFIGRKPLGAIGHSKTNGMVVRVIEGRKIILPKRWRN